MLVYVNQIGLHVDAAAALMARYRPTVIAVLFYVYAYIGPESPTVIAVLFYVYAYIGPESPTVIAVLFYVYAYIGPESLAVSLHPCRANS